MTANEIRDSFKKYFESKGHAIVPSAPMVIKDDPTLMFTNCGHESVERTSYSATTNPERRNRRADSRKCLRVSGKHNGSWTWSATTPTITRCLRCWATGVFSATTSSRAPSTRPRSISSTSSTSTPRTSTSRSSRATRSEGLSRDEEAAKFWRKHVPEDHIINGNKHDNFWEMGDDGPLRSLL